MNLGEEIMQLEVSGNILDKEQTKAALTNDKNTIIIAGAGSGKSLTMVGKIKYLVNYKKIDIDEILCITFTNDAANSLEKKIMKELGLINKVYTFHKLALEILKSKNITYSIATDDLLDFLIDEILIGIGNQPYFQNWFLTKDYFNNKNFINYKNAIGRFIKLFISNYYDINMFDKIIKKSKKCDKGYIMIIKKIYEIYILEKSSQGLIDFDDMIYMATKEVRDNGINKSYKYIIIDEYQDTSKIRENLVKEILIKTGALITVVGDDFQSIYRFSGCDLNNFLDFKKNFKGVKKLYLTNTYRNSQELINVAGDFVMKNPRQIHKKLKSKKRIEKPITILYYKDKRKDFLKALEFINKDNLMIIGRNNNDIKDYISNNLLKDNKLNYKNMNIYYKTIHKSKGLEENDILIINLTNDNNSLPSKIKDNNILKYVTIHKDKYPFEEERRLFYVGLTRTKNNCYLLVPNKNPSIFIEELLDNYKNYINVINL